LSGRESKETDIDPDIYKEYESQKKYLESSVNTLKQRLDAEQQVHKVSHMAIMEQNMKLIHEIAEFRQKVRYLDGRMKANKIKIKEEAENAENEAQNEDTDNVKETTQDLGISTGVIKKDDVES
jgi:hypothetical protein